MKEVTKITLILHDIYWTRRHYATSREFKHLIQTQTLLETERERTNGGAAVLRRTLVMFQMRQTLQHMKHIYAD